MTGIAFNAFTSQPQGVFTPLARADRLEVKLDESPPKTAKEFNHINNVSSETYVVLQGDYNIRLGPPGSKERIEAKTGDVFVVPRSVPHGDVTSRDGYRILLLEAPPQKGLAGLWQKVRDRL
jgi:mannose-6-phosphate isomerase-like protein (cupin superfamily)